MCKLTNLDASPPENLPVGAALPTAAAPPAGAREQDEVARRNSVGKAKGKGKRAENSPAAETDLEVTALLPEMERSLGRKPFKYDSVLFFFCLFLANISVGPGRNHYHFPFTADWNLRTEVRQGAFNRRQKKERLTQKLVYCQN